MSSRVRPATQLLDDIPVVSTVLDTRTWLKSSGPEGSADTHSHFSSDLATGNVPQSDIEDAERRAAVLKLVHSTLGTLRRTSYPSTELNNIENDAMIQEIGSCKVLLGE